jgi:hypothetical protein
MPILKRPIWKVSTSQCRKQTLPYYVVLYTIKLLAKVSFTSFEMRTNVDVSEKDDEKQIHTKTKS